jgi:hypothetical protein
MVRGNRSTNVGQQLVAPERTWPWTYRCGRISLDITHNFAALLIEPQGFWNKREASTPNVTEQALHVGTPRPSFTPDRIADFHDNGQSASGKSLLWEIRHIDLVLPVPCGA